MHIVNKFLGCLSYAANNLGNFFNRIAECCKCKSKPKVKITMVNSKDAPVIDLKLSDRIIKKDDKPAVKIEGDRPKEIIKNYLKYCDTNRSKELNKWCGLGSIESDGQIHGIRPIIFDRLQKAGLVSVLEIEPSRKKIVTPFLDPDDLELSDNFNLLKHNTEIEEKLKKITKAFQVLFLLTEVSSKNMKEYKTPAICFQKTSSPSRRNANTVIKRNQKASEQLKQALQQKVEKDKDELTQLFKHCYTVFGGLSYACNCQASRIQAYALFENLLNHSCDIFLFINSTNIYYKYSVEGKHIQHTFQILMRSVELLLPYAIEVSKYFNINIERDKDLQHMMKFAKLISQSTKEEFKEYQEIQEQLQETERKDNPRTAKKSPITDKGKDEMPFTMPPVMPPKGPRRSKEAPKRHLGTISQKEREEARTTRLGERRAVEAKEFVNKHKEEQSKQTEIEQKKRQSLQVKIHKLPSEELVWNVILPSLSDYDSSIAMMYGQEENHIQMSHKHVVNLAQAVQEALDKNDISCGQDFFNNVIARIHHGHDPDTGPLLKQNYLDILRSCFIIFGIFPKDWEPKTKEDFDAMEKYYQRRLDYFYWESRV